MKKHVFLSNNKNDIVEDYFNATNVLISSLFRKYFYSNFILKSSAKLARPMIVKGRSRSREQVSQWIYTDLLIIRKKVKCDLKIQKNNQS